MSWFKGAEYVI